MEFLEFGLVDCCDSFDLVVGEIEFLKGRELWVDEGGHIGDGVVTDIELLEILHDEDTELSNFIFREV